MPSVNFTFILKDKVSEKLKGINKGFEKLDNSIKGTTVQLEHFKKKTENIAKLGEKIKSVGQGLTVGLTLPIVAAGGAAVKFASDYEEALNKVDVAFGASSQVVKDWSKNSLTAMGLSKGEALDSAALYGDMATGMGLAQDQASQMAMRLTQLGADLASFKNISNDMAQTALKSIFTGETESLKNLGVVMTEANLQQYAYSKGIRKKMKNMSEAEKVNLRYNYVLDKTKNAHGDFERTGGGAANQMRVFQSSLKDLGETFGQYILPTFTKVLQKLNGMLKAFSGLPEPVKKGILILGVIVAAIGPLLIVAGQLLIMIAGLPAALLKAKIGFALLSKGVVGFGKSLWGLMTNPITWWIVGITAAIIAVIFVIKNWGKIVEWLKGVWQSVTSFISSSIANISKWLDDLIEKLGWIAYIIPGLNTVAISKKISDKVTGKDSKSVKNTTNNTTNNTTTNITNHNYSAGANPRSAQYAT